MKKLLLLLTVLTLGLGAQADMISLQNANYRHVKKTQTVSPAVSQSALADAIRLFQIIQLLQ
jgi:hypothetical protein